MLLSYPEKEYKPMLGARKQKPLSVIDDQEKQRRLEAASDAEASLRIEGLFISEKDKALSDKWINGEITDEEVEQIIESSR